MNIDDYMKFYSSNKKVDELKKENRQLKRRLTETLNDMGALVNSWRILAERAIDDEGTRKTLMYAICDTSEQFEAYRARKEWK